MDTPNFKAEAEALFDELVQLRRDFHRHPELGFQETRTSGIVADTLDRLGFEVQRGVGQTGVVGILEGGRAGPTLLMRFDMDALPIEEANETDYVSQNPGVMHACGHDGHTAMGLAVARIMARYQPHLAGTLKFLFQPAEEGLGGALAVIAGGALDHPRPDVALAMHLWNSIPYGKIRATPGPAMAASSVFTLTVYGKGGHGAAPHKSLDPILAAAHIVAALQSIVSRNIDPLDSVVVTVGQMTAGTTFNVIPDKAILKGTVRSYDNELHHLVYRRILEMAQNMAAAFRCQTSMETVAIVPAVDNAPAPTQVVKAAAARVVGQQNVVEGRTMGAEDMGYILEEIPGCYFFIGSMNEEKGFVYPHHHPQFDFDERAMINGVATMLQAAAHYVFP
ncbi:MAG: amidohydrolase [Chloroflexi bacterium]|nr:amidohydrolase [Chloroflexota bacterium]MCI0579071.1 amidohydrolase [Chloroflexota bacterium]MCI0649347.1 amidohydrolase [Chloroflexota bacterium]MCI0730155.1 amidohydrolase [Chloroflexota bacterium]